MLKAFVLYLGLIITCTASSNHLRRTLLMSTPTDFTQPTQQLLPGMGTVHPSVAQSPITQAITSQTINQPNKLPGIGLMTNQNQMKLPNKPSETALMSSHSAPGLPVWQQSPPFLPITPMKN